MTEVCLTKTPYVREMRFLDFVNREIIIFKPWFETINALKANFVGEDGNVNNSNGSLSATMINTWTCKYVNK